MANKKNTFVMYTDWGIVFRELPPEKCKQLILTIFDFEKDGIDPDFSDDLTMRIVWSQISDRLKTDAEKYAETIRKLAENGSKGGKASGRARSKVKQNEAIASKPKQMKQNQANEAVYVSVSDNVSDSVSVYDTDSVNDTDTKKNSSICSSSLVSVSVSNNKKDTDTTDTTTTNTDYLNIDFITEKIIELQKWSPDTSKSIARKFINLNDTHATVHHTSGWWQNRIDGFLAKETTPSDYAEWQSQQEEASHIMSKEELRRAMWSWDRSNPMVSTEERDNAHRIWRAYNEIHHADKQWEELPGVSSISWDENGVPCIIVADSNDIVYEDGRVEQDPFWA